jgi:hypothetical protein
MTQINLTFRHSFRPLSNTSLKNKEIIPLPSL